MQTARVAYFKTPGRVELRQEPLPQPGPGQVLVRVRACGICGSDMAWWRAVDRDWHRRGHEYAGEVAAMGEGVEDLAPGQLIAGIGSVPCGRCRNCSRRLPQFCLSPRGAGAAAFADYVVLAREFCFPIEGLSPAQGALIEPLTVALEMVRDGAVTLGSRVVILGAGPIGLMALRIAQKMGADVAVVHRRSSRARFSLAQRWGALRVIDAESENPAQAIRELWPEGADAALVTIPPSQGIPLAMEILTRGGTISLVGMQWGTMAAELDIDRFHFANLRLVGSNHNPAGFYYPEAARLLRDGTVPAEELISHRFPLDRIAEAFEFADANRGEVIKVIIEP